MSGPASAPARPCPGSPTCVTDVVVIGGGALGAATAWWLARSGRAVTLLEEGTGRELRHAARGIAWSAHPGWSGGPAIPDGSADAWLQLERQTGAALLTRGDALDQGDPAVLAALAGPGAELLDPDSAAARFPGTTFTGPVLLRPAAALQVRADHALAALSAGATGFGAVIRHRSPVSAVEAVDDQHVEVRTADGRIRARRAIVTSVVPPAARAVELHFHGRGVVRPGTPLLARHDPELGLLRAAPCAQGHLAVGAGSWPRGTLGDLRDHVRAWYPDLDVECPEPVGPESMSTVPAEIDLRWHGPVATATSTALGSVEVILRGRELAEQATGAWPVERRARRSV